MIDPIPEPAPDTLRAAVTADLAAAANWLHGVLAAHPLAALLGGILAGAVAALVG